MALGLVVAMAISMLSACKGVPDGVLDHEEMASLLADIHRGESLVESNSSAFPSDSAKRAFKQSIYARHGVTTAQVDSSLSWYGYHMEDYVEVYDRVLELLNDQLARAEQDAGGAVDANAGSLALEGDSVDVWPSLRQRRFSANWPSDAITFSVVSEPNWEPGDIYTLRAKTIDNASVANVNIVVEYTNGSREYVNNQFIGGGWHDVKLPLDSTLQAREIYGSIDYIPGRGEVAFIDSISLVRTRWSNDKLPLRNGVQRIGIKRYR